MCLVQDDKPRIKTRGFLNIFYTLVLLCFSLNRKTLLRGLQFAVRVHSYDLLNVIRK